MRLSATALVLLLVACQTAAPSLPEGLEIARPENGLAVQGPVIDTLPSGAALTHPGGTCRTPCRVDYGERVVVTVGKAGYQAMRVTVPAGAADALVELEPVGRSTVVEEANLPEL